jgi:hypothetical protein
MGTGIVDCDRACKFVRPFILFGSFLKIFLFEEIVSCTFKSIDNQP